MSLIDLPGDIIRQLAIEHLDPTEIRALCQTSLWFCQILYSNRSIWWKLIETQLTRNEKLISELKASGRHPCVYLDVFYADETDIYPDTYASLMNHRIHMAIECGFERYLANHIHKYDDGGDGSQFIMYITVRAGDLAIYDFLVLQHSDDDPCVLCEHLYYAAANNNLEMISYIMNKCKCEYNEDGDKPCHIQYRLVLQHLFKLETLPVDIIDCMVANGARLDENVNEYDDGDSLMSLALVNSVCHIKYLVDHSVRMPANALRYVLSCCELEYREMEKIVRYLVEELDCKMDDYEPWNGSEDDFFILNLAPGDQSHFQPKYLNIIPYLHDHGALTKYPEFILYNVYEEMHDISLYILRYLVSICNAIPRDVARAYERWVDINPAIICD